jgi:hypothetical protein
MPTEKPILFCGPMSVAIRDGRKTMTRRVVKMAGIDFRGGGGKAGPDWNDPSCWGFEDEGGREWALSPGDLVDEVIPCHYHVGQRLWVREACWIWGHWHRDGKTPTGRDKWRFHAATRRQVRFDKPKETAKRGGAAGWVYRHARFMPRWACRTILEVTDVRLERLQEITEEDAKAEGVTDYGVGYIPAVLAMGRNRYHFATLWDSLNGERPGCSWADNPFVLVISFRRVE